MHTKNQTLIKRLIEKTEAGDLRWNATSRPMQYSLSMSANQVIIERIANVGTIKYKFSILDAQGGDIDTITAQSSPTATPDSAVLRSLYETARRNANHIDETIDRLLDELS
ncbi:MAG: hypothetical protein DBY35_11570 [Bacteroidales bacterium]|nr:MAG: hypothetical protein DBY35_11570 [Bacteroidales bacterium]